MDLPFVAAQMDWQLLLAIICVVAAAAVVFKRALGWLKGSRQSACGSCPANQSKPLVPISSVKLSDSLKERTATPDGKR